MNYSKKNIVRNAMQCGELKECMIGVGKYEYPDIEDKNFPSPMNVAYILDCFYDLNKESPELGINKTLEKLLKEMLHGDIKDIFASIAYVDMQIYNEKKGLAGFILDRKILQTINQVVHDRKAELEATNGIREFDIHQNIMQVLRNINNRNINEDGFALFQE